MNPFKPCWVLALLLPVVAHAAGIAASLSPEETVRREEQRYKGEDMVSILAMTLTNSDGKVRRRELVWYHTRSAGISKDLQKFYYPQSIKDIATLKEEVKNEEDRQFLYLPAAKKMRRVSGKNQSWVGSDLIFEDLQEIKIDDWTYRSLGTTKIDGFDCSMVEMTPKPGADSAYSKRINYIRTDGSFYPGKVEFFDKSGKLLKALHNSDVRDHDGALYSTLLTVNNVQDKHKTELERLWIRVNTKFPDAIMTTRQMEKSVDAFELPAGITAVMREIAAKRDKAGEGAE